MKECIQCRQRKVNWIMFLQWNRAEQDADLEESGSERSEKENVSSPQREDVAVTFGVWVRRQEEGIG